MKVCTGHWPMLTPSHSSSGSFPWQCRARHFPPWTRLREQFGGQILGARPSLSVRMCAITDSTLTASRVVPPTLDRKSSSRPACR